MMPQEPIVISTENQNNNQTNSDNSDKIRKKKFFLFALLIIIIFVVSFLIFKKYQSVRNINKVPVAPVASSTPGVLPDFTLSGVASSTGETVSFSDLVIEYLSFADFYKSPDNNITGNIIDYKLPLNIKLDILNYPDVSRKLNLDPGLDNLNNNGFVLIDNPWEKEAPDFYSIYDNLESKQISPLITSDFIIYYYQNILKKVFKDIEENVFYNNLWSINKDLYLAAKNRYEARLAAIGDVNDSVLEGERLEMAYFAVSLELLKPTINQIAQKGVLADNGQFASAEADQFYFVLPPYLRDDVLREEKLIREANAKAKSPVLLYLQDYKNFIVPAEYGTNAKLNNFYLTTKWLNSVFPLNYRDQNCPECLLDKEDWRINFIAATLISNDAANLPDLKNKWARIYKVISFFKGLREDLDYIHYRDSLVSVFGNNYDVTQLFDDKNKFAAANLEKLKTKLLTYKMLEIQGAYNINSQTDRSRVGFKMLVEPYWPNDFLFDKLSVPNVSNYLGKTPSAGNNTSCFLNSSLQRCNGIALDIVNLVSSVTGNNYFLENTNYLNYNREADKLRLELNKNKIWQNNNYWSTLSFIKAFLNINKTNQPLLAKSSAWQTKSLNTAEAAWVNLQLPLEKFSVNQIFRGVGLTNYSSWGDNAYVEPNLDLINELQANNTMISKMLTALQLDKEVSQAFQGLNSVDHNFNALKKVIIKELQGENLNQDDKDVIVDFAKQLKITQTPPINKQLIIPFPTKGISLKANLNNLKLLVLIHQVGDGKVISVGPVWDYSEYR